MNNVVVHFLDGQVIKGTTNNFLPNRYDFFHLQTKQEKENRKVVLADLKAVFIVRSLEGKPEYKEVKEFPKSASPGMGKQVRVECSDGEVIVGYTQAYRAELPGFFVNPPDPASNNERIYLRAKAVKKVDFLQP